ncbi:MULTISPECIES: winged helix-turn-helix transcriptional regulator [Microbacterium]|jgi:DNA-binding HxlR family transcriptional regulator|uniref:Helix-turn-helix domain-containing protein n=1 Tax=Microbacterium aquilitoris TaxID=3067307 RepID=A0ABU3GFC2_9MICO|nr:MULTISPECIES: helix-turn-helix domain-containing protein [unclassified Microbacterium]MDT3329395.1 helix-turn-helix domain-containing protein [Microbacterium sp. KSW-18]MDT3345244.1 helix-turn-helix domain-containing protein [Microbacterium sp. KSW2-22]SDG58696.1 DNA-binding transcriptional regulator, HxlR family [Microbacterium sp. 77mftsu3.1]
MADDHDARQCDAAVSHAFSILGKRWNGMILDVLGEGELSFSGVRRAVSGISDAVLSDRLTELSDAGLIARQVEPGPPVAVTYALTEAGCRLAPILTQLGEWADGNLLRR